MVVLGPDGTFFVSVPAFRQCFISISTRVHDRSMRFITVPENRDPVTDNPTINNYVVLGHGSVLCLAPSYLNRARHGYVSRARIASQ